MHVSHLRRWSFVLAMMVICELSSAQNWAGFETGNYAGLNSLAVQPADLVSSPYRVDVNIFSMTNNVFGDGVLPRYKVFNGGNGSIVADLKELLTIKTERYVLRSTTLLPSVSYSINDRSAIAFTWSVRATGYGKVSEIGLHEILQDAVDGNLANQSYDNEIAGYNVYGWSEYGLTYSRRIWEDGVHRLNAGVSLKFLQGIGEVTYELGNIDLKLDGTGALEYLNANFRYRYSDQVHKLVEETGFNFFGSAGFATDLGLSYERRNADAKDNEFPGYKYKLGISVADLGGLSFDAAEQRNLTVSATDVSLETFSGISTIPELVDTLARIFDINEDESLGSYRIKMPTKLSFIADYNFGKNLFVNLQQSLIYQNRNFKNEKEGPAYLVNLTPRYETQRYGLYLPMMYGPNVKFNTGIALRWKGLSIGSSNIVSRWFYNKDIVVGDLYFSGKFPLMHQRYMKQKLPSE